MIHNLKSNKLVELVKIKNNETFGISCELAIIKIFNGFELPSLVSRSDNNITNLLTPHLKNFFIKNKIDKLNYVGLKQNKADFIDNNDKSYSIKSNLWRSNKVCPQIIGQCSLKKFNQNIYSKLSSNNNKLLNNEDTKNFILENPNKLFLLYFEGLFCCDNTIYIKQNSSMEGYDISLYKTNDIVSQFKNKCFNDKFNFSRKESWNESSTLKVLVNNKNISIGEFQIHNSRDCIKFRFNFNNLIKYIESK